ncbi:MAG: polymorphic toxin-type HINT domain-containing protein [Pirellulales bacterium]
MRLVLADSRRFMVAAAMLGTLPLLPGSASAQPPAAAPNVAGDAPKAAAEKLYAAALEAEAAGDGSLRNKLLKQAIQFSPDFAPAHWRLGEVRDGDKWRTVDELAERWAADARLDEYKRRRAAGRDNLASNLALARWASKSALRDEAEVHWRRVLARRPQNDEAAKALGLKRLNGKWLPHDDYAVAADHVRKAKRAGEFWKPRVSAIRRDLLGPTDADRAGGLAAVRAITDREAIPTLQEAFSLADPRDPFRPINETTMRFPLDKAWNLEYVALLGRWPEIEATKALVREAVISPLEDVRVAAARELAKRPLHHFVPRLLAGLVSPIDARVTLAVDDRGRVAYRRMFFREGPLADTVRTYDDFYQNFVTQNVAFSDGSVGGIVTEQPVPSGTVNSLAAEAAAIKAAAAAVNAQIHRLNERIVAAASRSTGVDLPVEVADWWRWWQDYNDLYVADEKPVYEATYANYYAPYPKGWSYTPGPPPPAGSGGSVSRGPCCCFVAGTLVMTKTGPKPIDTIRIGDMVLAQDVETGELAFKAVIGRAVRPAAPVLAIGLGSETIRVTRGHPFWVAGENWQMAKFLRQGDRLQTAAGPSPISAIDEAAAEATYNLIVADWHNYFVGDRRVLVHDNAPQQPTVMRLPGMK